MTHLTLWTLGERGSCADLQEIVIEERCKYDRSTCLLISLFFFCFICPYLCHFLLLFPCLNVTLSLFPRDDNFSDTLSQKADSEASSGHTGDDKCSGKDIGSPTDTRISESYISRFVYVGLVGCFLCWTKTL